jgi:hypothetical protein
MSKSQILAAYPDGGEEMWEALRELKRIRRKFGRVAYEAAVGVHRLYANPIRRKGGRKPII